VAVDETDLVEQVVADTEAADRRLRRPCRRPIDGSARSR
jgi:hypothetical protein